jgi:hypothetical protein
MVTTSPLETLLSYALVFVAGVGSVFAVRAYGRAQRERGRRLGVAGNAA